MTGREVLSSLADTREHVVPDTPGFEGSGGLQGFDLEVDFAMSSDSHYGASSP